MASDRDVVKQEGDATLPDDVPKDAVRTAGIVVSSSIFEQPAAHNRRGDVGTIRRAQKGTGQTGKVPTVPGATKQKSARACASKPSSGHPEQGCRIGHVALDSDIRPLVEIFQRLRQGLETIVHGAPIPVEGQIGT
jgi:hypothetical protein